MYINCFDKTMLFYESERNMDSRLLFVSQVEMSLRENDPILAMFAYLKVANDVTSSDVPMVYEFPDVFAKDIFYFPIECKVEFVIVLVPSTIPVSMPPYRISALELGELKKQLEDLLEKKFVRLSVLPLWASVLLGKKKDGSIRLCIDYP